MALASSAAENAALSGITALAIFVSLHTATPGTSGASEYAGVTRQSVTWGSPSSGSVANTNALTFTTSGASAVTFAGSWSASTAGTYYIGLTLTSSVTATNIVAAAGSLTLAAS